MVSLAKNFRLNPDKARREWRKNRNKNRREFNQRVKDTFLSVSKEFKDKSYSWKLQMTSDRIYCSDTDRVQKALIKTGCLREGL